METQYLPLKIVKKVEKKMHILVLVNCRHRLAIGGLELPGTLGTRTGFQRTFFLPLPGGVFGDGVVFAGILVALAGPFWPGGAAPRGVAIFVPVLVSAPCKPKQGRVVFATGKGYCHLESMPAPAQPL